MAPASTKSTLRPNRSINAKSKRSRCPSVLDRIHEKGGSARSTLKVSDAIIISILGSQQVLRHPIFKRNWQLTVRTGTLKRSGSRPLRWLLAASRHPARLRLNCSVSARTTGPTGQDPELGAPPPGIETVFRPHPAGMRSSGPQNSGDPVAGLRPIWSLIFQGPTWRLGQTPVPALTLQATRAVPATTVNRL